MKIRPLSFVSVCVLILAAPLSVGMLNAIAIKSLYAQIGQAPIGGHQIGGPVSTPHEATPAQSPAHSQDQRVETYQGYTAVPQSLLAGQKTADQITPDERLRSAVEFCEMDFAKPSVTQNITTAAPLTYANPDCDKVMKVWADSSAKERYEQEVAAWRASQIDREKQLISRVAREAK